jgi:hypothetical protein
MDNRDLNRLARSESPADRNCQPEMLLEIEPVNWLGSTIFVIHEIVCAVLVTKCRASQEAELREAQ